jgi:hypothetical protein
MPRRPPNVSCVKWDRSTFAQKEALVYQWDQHCKAMATKSTTTHSNGFLFRHDPADEINVVRIHECLWDFDKREKQHGPAVGGEFGHLRVSILGVRNLIGTESNPDPYVAVRFREDFRLRERLYRYCTMRCPDWLRVKKGQRLCKLDLLMTEYVIHEEWQPTNGCGSLPVSTCEKCGQEKDMKSEWCQCWRGLKSPEELLSKLIALYGEEPDPLWKHPWRTQDLKTPPQQNSVSAVWSDHNTFDLPVMSASDVLRFVVWDKNLVAKDEFLGQVEVPIEDLVRGVPLQMWVDLEYPPRDEKYNSYIKKLLDLRRSVQTLEEFDTLRPALLVELCALDFGTPPSTKEDSSGNQMQEGGEK